MSEDYQKEAIPKKQVKKNQPKTTKSTSVTKSKTSPISKGKVSSISQSSSGFMNTYSAPRNWLAELQQSE
jgi:hypothetical protein